ncbi:hypothetical protein UlMin_018545 [Ulmus minor]
MSKMENFKHLPFSLLLVLALLLLVHSQDQSGFISLDCGLPTDSNYAEPSTKINYVSDAPFIGGAGVSKSISTLSKVNLQEQLKTLRSFPDGIRNCYKINVKKGTKYLFRASFKYGNYDGQNKPPQFDVHLGVSFWTTVKFENTSLDFTYGEIVHVPLQDYLPLCLVNTGSGIPFVSSIELRPLPNNTYVVPTGSLSLVYRGDVATPNTRPAYRYPVDLYDRIWLNYFDNNWSETTTSRKVDPFSDFEPPTEVMSTAGTPKNENSSMDLNWVSSDSTAQYFVYLHFAELQNLTRNQYRAFNITLNGKSVSTTPKVPIYLVSTTVYSTFSFSGETNYTLSLTKLENSTLPPILSAFELYQLMDLSQPETDQDDVDAITNIKSTYGLKKNWDGDPCAPVKYLWEGLNCTYNSESPRIISLNLSSSRLNGAITEHILNLSMIQSLDLSNNNLTGSVPDFLSQLPNLKFLNLERNQLTGVVPPELVEKSKNGGLSLSVGENSNLCTSSPCETKNKNNNILVPVGASVGGLVILLLVAAAVLFGLKRRKKTGVVVVNVVPKTAGDSLESNRKRQFTYAEVIKITNNFERIVGRGGFGTVFHGFIDDTQVAVKMLSPSSVQGYQQFQAEVKLLMRVHHRNLTSLVGYCNEGTNMALIYEFMANGDLGQHLSGDGNANITSWDVRLQIATDAAQGLEYLHNGCKPPIVHRDVKTANILLTERFQAKLADFGLSRIFQTEDGGTHVSTVAAGTPGYLDPEYYLTSRLNEKSDVYSFGVVLLQLITSRPAISRINENERIHISQWVSVQLGNGDINSIADPRLQGDFDTNSMWKAVEIAMACLSQSATRRPNMSIVVTELKECLVAELSRRGDSRVTDTTDSTNDMLSLRLTTELTPLAR